MKNLLTKTFIASILLVAGLLVSCDKDDPTPTLAAPTSLQYDVLDQENVKLTWGAVDNADSYTIEIFTNGTLNFEGTPARTINDITESPYTITGLDADTDYSVRMRALATGYNDSDWKSVAFKTGAPVGTLSTPANLDFDVIDHSNVELSWDDVDDADSYTIEVFRNGSLNFEGTPESTIPNITTIPYTLIGLSSDTDYSVRIRAVSAVLNDSEWTGVTFKTDQEQLFQTVGPDDVTKTTVVLRWEAGQAATRIVLTPGDIIRDLVANDIASGSVIIMGLTEGTEYTAKLMNNAVVRGTVMFTTLSTPQPKQVLYLTGDLIDGVAEWANSYDEIGDGLQVLFSDNSDSDGKYTYTGLFNGDSDFKLPTVAGSATGQYGYNFSTSGLELDADDIPGPYAAGYYTLSVNLSAMTVDFSPYAAGATAPTYTTMSIFGDANPGGWVTGTAMSETSPHVWVTYGMPLTEGELVIRANHDVIDYWGAATEKTFPYGKAEKNSATNIVIPEAGEYFIQFNDMTGHYIIIKNEDMPAVY